MSKIQTILSLLLFLIIIFVIDMIFDNLIRKTFNAKLEQEQNIDITNFELKKTNGNIIYSGSGFLDLSSLYPKGDDQPLFFGFSS
jgi:hypothetical protein